MKLVIFDCDGTLVDSQHAIVEAMNMAFAASALREPRRNDVLSVVGLSLSTAVMRLLPSKDPDLAVDVAERYKQAFGELRRRPEHDEPMFPGARAAIERLAARDDVRLGIATGKSRRGVDALFEREGLGGFFSTIQTADDHPSKPHPAMIFQAMSETDTAPGRTVMVGDTTFDIEMALSADVGAIGVHWGYHPAEDLAGAGAHALIADYADLDAAVDRLLRERETKSV